MWENQGPYLASWNARVGTNHNKTLAPTPTGKESIIFTVTFFRNNDTYKKDSTLKMFQFEKDSLGGYR